ncbi:MAG: formate dehydrogenase, partial [Alphaproteobacteria bacterium]|nr:formate dehydrogenase [Alphaproteobacteria bacterium]
MVKVFIPRDSSARSVGADEVAAALAPYKDKLGLEIIRNGSRGLFWLEPMVEVEAATGRVAYGP